MLPRMPGQPLRSLAKVASGGELSRIGLAIQVITSRDSAVPTLIFDVADGASAVASPRSSQPFARLGQDRQVYVTHLPQVAACADWQWRIAKREQGGDAEEYRKPPDDAAGGGGRARRREYHRDHYGEHAGRDARLALIASSTRPGAGAHPVAMPGPARGFSPSRPRLGQFPRWQSA